MARFKPGQSGNPGGRPKGGYSERCRIWADSQGFDFLVRIAEGREPGYRNRHSLRIEAAKYLTDRGYGKAPLKTDTTAKISLENFLGGTWEDSATKQENHGATYGKTPIKHKRTK